MRTDVKADETALMLLDYTTPSLFDLSDLPRLEDVEPPEFPWAPAWSSSPLGDPGVDDDGLESVDEYGPEARVPQTPVAAVAAAAIGMLGLGVLVGVAVVDFAAAPAPLPTVTIAAHSVPAPPKLMMSTAPSVTAVPPAASVPVTTTVPGPVSGPTFQVLPCNPMPFCV